MLLRPALIEFPADDPDRARAFWSALVGTELGPRGSGQGAGWQSATAAAEVGVGVHDRGRGPGDSFSLPYFEVEDLEAALTRVSELGGAVIHPGSRWAICRDTEGSPFGLAGPGD